MRIDTIGYHIMADGYPNDNKTLISLSAKLRSLYLAQGDYAKQ